MRRKAGKFSIVDLLQGLRTSRGAAWFAVGAMMGASILLVRLSLNELNEVQARSYEDGSAKVNLTEGTAGTKEKDARLSPSLGSIAAQGGEKSAIGEETATKEQDALEHLVVRVYLTKQKRIESVPLETYVRGVVAAEMPIGFELEALKAQAIAARTYMVRRMVQGNDSGVPVKGADVTDTTEHQVYISLSALAEKWSGDEQKSNIGKLNDAIEQTKGIIITYQGEPIDAAFFSTSNGYTENSEDYWQQKIPYLRSVASPWDQAISPKYKETVKLSLKDFYSKLGLSKKQASKLSIRVIEKTEGNRVSKIAIGETTLTGREVREKLGLASSQFIWSIKGNIISITTYGYGHGVGMSQWGANGMAEAGASAEDILTHYYSSVQVEQASKLPNLVASHS
ncbi:stage II sporulation protein D [Paenibacillus luteus]|uniref:stage II sporulation protein D n=1 Tax=Paenibacillus luteus TaxID=2545753 RepID=UPI001F4FC78A|nr:stage II sporulation protein D [Paenibacillus luteus]